MKVANNMDSVFGMANDDDLEFDVMFDQEDSLIDTVNGVNEAGDPLTGVDFEDLHQTQDDASIKDVKDMESDDKPMGAPNPEGTKDPVKDDTSVKGEVNKNSDADKLYNGTEDKYQDDKEKKVKSDPDKLYDTIDKVVEGTESIEDEIEKESCKESKDESCDESVNIDSIEDEISKAVQNKDIKPCDEAAEVDSDIVKVDDSDYDEDDALIDAAMGNSGEAVNKDDFSYDPTDEELIDMAIRGETF